MKKVKLEGSYYEMGTQLGRMIKGKIALPQASTKKLEWASRCVEEMEHHTPGLLDELQGIADAANLEKEQLDAIILYDCSYIKKFLTSTSPIHHCTVFTIPGKHTENGMPVVARNYDWLTEVQDYFAIHLNHPANKLRNLLFTDHYVGGFGGINEAGLACGCTVAAYYNGNIKPRIMLNMAMRWILDSFRKVEDAVNFLENISLSEGNIYLIADRSGASARVEASPDKVFTTHTRDEFLIATNHYQSEEMKHLEIEITETNAHTTITRLEGITNWYYNQEKPITIDSIKTILRDHKFGVCDHNGEAGTLWSWIATLGSNEVEICSGNPCIGNYQSESVI
ncbi:MAG: C45 family autoproteolytic acyltransferase/hydrolase [Candidatus Hodarchaeales archaeon]|jgi:predicted choloylglycine hydrolase